MGESCREAKRCSLFSFFPLLLLPGPPPLGSRLSVKSPSTARPLGLVLALAPVVILNHGPRSAMPLRSGATPDITMTTLAGMETTVLTRWAPGTAAPESATCPATGTPRSTVTWVWTATDAGWATTACPSSLVDVLPLQALAATMAAVLVVLEPAPNLTLRSATALRSTVTLDMTLISAGTETTALTRLTSGTAAMEFALSTATGRLRTGATWALT